MPWLIFKLDGVNMQTVEVKINSGVDSPIFDDFNQTLYCDWSTYKRIDEAHSSGKSYREIFNGIEKISDIKI